ncbi:hypothetical protein [Mesorhizobium captivum]|uniref:hypothetical protein n=1 Tax=Mesorhizobium captivum TaxID=3072319 RepID=UPI002A24940B|nr:hypothetical protein [Mesorhizobium sp. VK23E]MDX8513585.1 hypothetical protein [Mesorhizobium sp. VK23E]
MHALNSSTGARTNPDADDFWSQAKGALDQFDANIRHRVTELLEANNRYQQEARDARAALRGGFQDRVKSFMLACFGETIAADGVERNHRFLEEAIELVQSLGCTASEAHQLVDYVFGRPVGDPHQETGGVEVTLAALCNAHGLDKAIAAENELTRVWGKIDKIRAKQAAKPKHSPLPEHSTVVKSVAEWHEDDGFAVWWTWRDGAWLGEPSYIGSPLCSDWPGYHTHWTPHPTFPSPPVATMEAIDG